MTSVANFLTSRQGSLAILAGRCAIALGTVYCCTQNDQENNPWGGLYIGILGTLGQLGLYLCENVAEKIRNAQVLDPDEFAYRIRREHRTPLEQETVTKAMDRIKNDFPEGYRCYTHPFLSAMYLNTNLFHRPSLEEGCCMGQANAIFDQICCGTSTSLPEGLHAIRNKDEDVIYSQTLSNMNPENLQLIGGINSGNFSFFDIGVEDQKIERCFHPLNFTESKKFPKESSSTVYREIFEKAMCSFPEEQNVIGLIEIPSHVISIQYGPRGYFLYDPFGQKKGLFEYVDPDTFFSQLKKHVLYDVKIIIEMDAPEPYQGKKRKALETQQLYYRIRPLRHINPNIQARELPPEGWMTQINRTYNSFAHRLAITALPPVEEEMPSSVKAYIVVDVGYGNTLGIRADGAWETTVPFEWTSAGWRGELPLGKEFKFVKVLADGDTVQWERLKGNRILDENCRKVMTLGGNNVSF